MAGNKNLRHLSSVSPAVCPRFCAASAVEEGFPASLGQAGRDWKTDDAERARRRQGFRSLQCHGPTQKRPNRGRGNALRPSGPFVQPMGSRPAISQKPSQRPGIYRIESGKKQGYGVKSFLPWKFVPFAMQKAGAQGDWIAAPATAPMRRNFLSRRRCAPRHIFSCPVQKGTNTKRNEVFR